jgi:hypothetical protein
MQKDLRTFVLFIMLLLSVMFCDLAKSQEVISAHDLYNYSLDNDYAFNLKYKDKTIRVKGTVDEVGKATLGYYYVRLKRDKVYFYFPSGKTHQLAEISSGDEITVEGRCDGRGALGNSIDIWDCTLLRRESIADRRRAEAERERQAELERERRWEAERPQREAEERQRLEAKKRERAAKEKAAQKAKEEREAAERQREAQERERLEAVRLQREAEEQERRVRAEAEERRRQAEAAERERERKEAEAAAAIEAAIESYYQSHFFIVSSKITGSSSTRDEDKEKNGGKSVKSTYAGFTVGFAVSSIGIYVSPQLEVWLDQNDRTLSNQEKAERKNLPRRRVGLNNGIYTVGGIVGERSFHLYLGGGIHLREDELADLKVRRSYIIEGGCRIPFGSCFTFDLGLGYSGHRQANLHTGLGLIF